MHFAINNKAENADVVKLLLESKADVHAKTPHDGITPLWLAVNNGHSTITRMLIEENASLEVADTAKGNTVLHVACEKSLKDIVNILATETTYQRLFNLKNKEDKTPLEISEEKSLKFTTSQIHGGSSSN